MFAAFIRFWVEAFAASWIEINVFVRSSTLITVEAFAASWIEITVRAGLIVSHLVEAFAASWIEIKYAAKEVNERMGRSLCGFVD